MHPNYKDEVKINDGDVNAIDDEIDVHHLGTLIHALMPLIQSQMPPLMTLRYLTMNLMLPKMLTMQVDNKGGLSDCQNGNCVYTDSSHDDLATTKPYRNTFAKGLESLNKRNWNRTEFV